MKLNFLQCRSVAVSAAGLCLLAGCGISHGPAPVGRYIDDASITDAVKTRFVEDGTIPGQAIRVDTRDGTVVLSGQTRSSLERTNAESITMKVPGVKLVRNELVIRP